MAHPPLGPSLCFHYPSAILSIPAALSASARQPSVLEAPSPRSVEEPDTPDTPAQRWRRQQQQQTLLFAAALSGNAYVLRTLLAQSRRAAARAAALRGSDDDGSDGGGGDGRCGGTGSWVLVDYRDETLETPLHAAAFHGHADCVQGAAAARSSKTTRADRLCCTKTSSSHPRKNPQPTPRSRLAAQRFCSTART